MLLALFITVAINGIRAARENDLLTWEGFSLKCNTLCSVTKGDIYYSPQKKADDWLE